MPSNYVVERVTAQRKPAGDILLHPDYGFMYYGSVFTEMPR
jgi:hypothetical protein